MSELIGLLIGFILTLFVYSYLVGDNPLYRVAVHILVGVSAAYAAVIVVQQVLWPVYEQIRQDPNAAAALVWLVPILLAFLLIFRSLPSIGWVGNSTLALLVGMGAAVALVGAILGTLWPQVTAIDAGSPVRGLFVGLFTVCTLLIFQFSGHVSNEGNWIRPVWQRGLVTIGRAVLMITFGALFANVLNTSLILLADRLDYFLSGFLQILS